MNAWFDLDDEKDRSRALAYLAKGILNPRRNSEQNRLLHAILGELSKSVTWAGKRRDPETWKRLLTASWLRAKGESVEVLPALDGHGIDVVFRKTSSLTKTECADLIDWITAWAVENGIEFDHEAERAA